ncbi:hypothetical protein, partial [Streptomyces syringium]|uniref:hypothetical protein n=1 Tax=Streptomyces syringium TaxID=76729 RepID=UPI0037D74B76
DGLEGAEPSPFQPVRRLRTRPQGARRRRRQPRARSRRPVGQAVGCEDTFAIEARGSSDADGTDVTEQSAEAHQLLVRAWHSVPD